MALNSATLALALRAKVIAKNPALAAQLSTQIDLDWLLEAIAEAVVEHVTTSATVTVSVPSVSGVTTGVGVSGPGIGTGTIS